MFACSPAPVRVRSPRPRAGHYTVLFDWLFGTLVTPAEYDAKYSRAKELGKKRD